LIDRFGASLLLSCGTAGAIAPQRQVGDVVLAERVAPHDNGWQTGSGFLHLGVYNSALPDGRHYRRDWPANPVLLDAARRALRVAPWPDSPPVVVAGVLASGEQVIASAEKKRWLHDAFAAEAVDMESAAVAQVAALNGIDWLAVRAISDTADSSLDIDITQLITYAESPDTLVGKVQRTAKSLSQLAGNPRQAEALVRLRQGLKLAAQHAALSAEAIVGVLS
jgi:nucleoside phosphorylase